MEKESRGTPSIRPAGLSASELEGREQESVRSDRQVRLQPTSPGEEELTYGARDQALIQKSPGSPQGRRARARLSTTGALKKVMCLNVVLVASAVGWLLPSLETAAYSSRPLLSQRQRRNLQDSLRRYRDDSELQAEYLLKARDHRPVDTSARLDLLELCARSNSVLTAATESLGGTADRVGLHNHVLLTTRGYAKVRQIILECRPRHVWGSPDCGPLSHIHCLQSMNWRMQNRSRHELARRRTIKLAIRAVRLMKSARKTCKAELHFEHPLT